MNRQKEEWNDSETGRRPDESFPVTEVKRREEVNCEETEVKRREEVNCEETEVNQHITDLKTYDGYLTEEELYQLITETEESDLIKAPSDFMEQVLSRMASAHGWEENEILKQEEDGVEILIDKPPREDCVGNDNNKMPGAEQKRKKQMEYRRYCLRVVTSCAAAILLLLLLPNLEPLDRDADFFQQDTIFGSEREKRITDLNWMSFHFLRKGLEENAGFRDAEGITKEDNTETTLQNLETDKNPETAEKEGRTEDFAETEDESFADGITENEQKHQPEERKGILESLRHSRRIFDFQGRSEKD